MEKDKIIEKTIGLVKQKMKNFEPGHDWWHIYRVWNLSKKIYDKEKETNKSIDNESSRLIVELGALLHDIADYKFVEDEKEGETTSRDFLNQLGVDKKIINKVVSIINNISYKGEAYEQKVKFAELDIVQDADRLDAIGAIGIARAFSYGGHKKVEMFNPDIKPRRGMSKEEYIKYEGTTINHFYEKLLLLKDRMNTETGRRIAEHRHRFMELFLDEFYKEWDGLL